MSDPIFHIVDADDWARAVATGTYSPPSVAAEGFVHCSFADQVAGTANLRFAGVSGLVVVELDPGQAGVELVVEDSYGSGTAFPHLYGAIATAAAVGVHRLSVGADGRFSFPPGDAASTDR